MKQFVYISDPEQWLSQSEDVRSGLLYMTDSPDMTDYGWVLVQEVDIQVDVSDDIVRKAALAHIEKDEKKAVAENEIKMQRFKERRQKLLAITHQVE